MNEFDPRYRTRNFFGSGALPGGTAPGRHDISRAAYLAKKGRATHDPFGSGRR